MTAEQEPEQLKQEPAKPWGRLTLVSKDPAEDSDHIYLTKKTTKIGRNKRHCDATVDRLFISSVHCIVKLVGTDKTGEPIAELHDKSRNGIWVNADKVGKDKVAQLGKGYTVHFTKPGTRPAGTTPLAYKFELLNSDEVKASSPKSEENGVPAEDVNMTVSSPKGEENAVPENDANMTVVADESFEATQLTAPADPPSPLEKKRKRDDEAPVVVTVATQELESKLKAAQDQVSALTEELEQTVQVKVNKLQQENMDLMTKLEAATSENLQLKTDLAAKDKSTEAKLHELRKTSEEAVAAETSKFEHALAAKEKAMGLKIKEAVKKSLEEDHRAKDQEMAAKLKEATKKYQQKVEAEHFEQRREMSEKMAAYANENEKLQTALATKEDELAECEDKILSLGKKVVALEEQISEFAAKEAKLVEYEEKIGELEDKVNASKDESSEILGLLAAAEEKVIAAENKAAEAAIAAQAAASSNSGADATERKELQAAVVSLRSELEAYRTQMGNREEEMKKEKEAATAAAVAAAPAQTVSPPSIAATSIAQEDDAEVLRARLSAALNLFGQVQALGLRGMSLITGTEAQELGDLLLLSVASAESERTGTSTAVPSSPGSSPSGDVHPVAAEGSKESPAKPKPAKKAVEEDTGKSSDNGDRMAAEPKTSPSKLKREKKKTLKQAAPLSAAIEADAASAIAAMASVEDSAKSSPSDASTAVANGDGDGDWEMLE